MPMNKANSNMRFSAPHGRVRCTQAKAKATTARPTRSKKRARAPDPPAYVSKAEQMKKANEFLKILFSS